MPTQAVAAPVDFRSLAAAHFHCAPEAVEKAVFRHCLYFRARFVSWLLPRGAFAEDWQLIRAVAGTKSLEELVTVVNRFRDVRPDEESLMHLFKLRISGKKLIRLADEVFPVEEPGETGD